LLKLIGNLLDNRSDDFRYFFTCNTLDLVDNIGHQLLRRGVCRNAAKDALQEWNTCQFTNQLNARLNGCTQSVLTRVKSALQAVLPCLIGGVGDTKHDGCDRPSNRKARNRDNS
jgi:hypothetical protein